MITVITTLVKANNINMQEKTTAVCNKKLFAANSIAVLCIVQNYFLYKSI